MISGLFSRFLAHDENSRALQLSGFLRFGLIVLQGIILVKLGFDPLVIAIVESFYFLFNLSRFYLLSGGKYAGFSKFKDVSYSFASVFWGFNVIGLISLLIGALVIYFGQNEFASFLGLPYVNYLLPILLFFSLPVDAYDFFYIEKKKPFHIVTYTGVVTLIQIVGLVVLLNAGYHMGHVVVFLTGLFALRYLHLLFVSKAYQSIKLNVGFSFMVFAIPLILHSLLAGLTDYVDGWLIKSYFDDAAFAIYRYGARELPLNAIIISAVISGLIMQKSETSANIKLEMTKVLKTLAPILGLLILISPWLFQVVYSEEYMMSALYFNIYALLILSHALFVQVYLYKNDDRWLLTYVSLGEVVFNVILSLVLLKYIGIVGIPLATLIVDVLTRLFMMILVRKRYGVSLKEYYPWKAHLLSSAALVTCFAISYFMFFK